MSNSKSNIFYSPETIQKYDLFLHHMSVVAYNHKVTLEHAMDVYHFCSGDFLLMKMYMNPFTRQNYLDQVWSPEEAQKFDSLLEGQHRLEFAHKSMEVVDKRL